MEAIGMIETRGITASIIGADAMLKSANVKILEKTIVGGGNVVITVTGDIGAVNAAVEAGESSIKNLNSSLFVTKNIIPRPDKGLEGKVLFPIALGEKDRAKEEKKSGNKEVEIKVVEENIGEKKEEEKEEVKIIEENKDISKDKKEVEVERDNLDVESNKLTDKKHLDNIVLENDMNKVDNILNELRVREVRKLARQYDELEIKPKDIKTATKASLIKELKKYYEANKIMKS